MAARGRHRNNNRRSESMLAHIHDGADFAVILVVLAVGVAIGIVFAVREFIAWRKSK
jgi:hypothetical protein